MAKSFAKFSFSELKSLLDEKADQYNNSSFISDDPISIVHRFSDKRDREIIGLLIATIAWGNRKIILKSGENLLNVMGGEPHQFVLNAQLKDLKHLKFVHRTFNQDDLVFMIRAMQNLYQNNKSLEDAFGGKKKILTVKDRLILFRQTMLAVNHLKRSEKHISSPISNSACKRLNMYLRWMVRSDKRGVDFGIWKSISPAELYLPLDVHTGRIARELGLLQRMQDDWKALEEIMGVLRKMDSSDPVKYDFALFGMGAYEFKKKW